jgi:hypothetical protein
MKAGNHSATWWRDRDTRGKRSQKYREQLKVAGHPPAEVSRRLELEARTFSRREEWPAFLYELARRAPQDLRATSPAWCDLPVAMRNRIIAAFPRRPDDLIAPPFHAEAFDVDVPRSALAALPKHGDTTPPALVTVDLAANDAAIVAGFRRWLALQRAQADKPKPAPNAGRARRGLSWQYLEVLDAPALDGDSGKSSMRAKAKRLAATEITPEIRRVFGL